MRTRNASEIYVAHQLMEQGYTVLKRGWPDFLAFKGNDVRFIEVKRKTNIKGDPRDFRFKPHQSQVAEVLSRIGIKVELIHGL